MAERLSRERILEVAQRLAREDGLEALSMRRIAEQLDVWPMSIYRYFQDKDALLDAIAQGVEAPPAASGTGDSRAQLRELATAVRTAVLSRPAGLGDRLPRVLEAPAMEVLAERARVALGGERDADAAWRTISTYAFGAAVRGLDDDAFGDGLDLLLDAVESRRPA